ncbi:MAG TPA: DHH family phosphoesterase [Brumimicrobium sp.]|nr:DHH family phosphoesterase [Brumimicrobium sp.]
MTFKAERINPIKKIISESKTAVIVAHQSPDGDSVGSSVGLYHYLVKKGLEVQICHPDPAPHFLMWMKGTETIKNAIEHSEKTTELIENADLIFCLDFNSMSRAGGLKNGLLEAKGTKVMIDHHLDPSDEFHYTFSEPSACSTAQLIIDFIIALGDEELIDVNIGEALYCGMMTDTGSFRFPSVEAHTHELVALLMKKGLKPYVVHESVYDTNTFDRLRLHSFAINEQMEVVDNKTAIIHLNEEDLTRFNYKKGDTEGLVNVGLSISGIKRSIFLVEMNGIIKISFRSKGENNPVNVLASTYFQGGGHANASGGKWEGSMEEAIQRVKSVLPKFDV